MTEGECPFRSFTMRSEGYDRDEVDAYVGELQSEITEQRRALAAAT
ncbi:MAG: DivIVA domain-containing protein, partial [Acidimicrobiaceae bacterium]|nr:DivIVA domain-containing protein [Acidimicrobiaceae bacterium]